MRTAMLILVGLFITSSVFAVEPLDLKLDNNWKRTSEPPPKDGWSWQTWRHERGDILTIAEHAVARKLTSDGDLDRAMDFASSAYPQWMETTEFPTWDDEDFDPRFLKLKTDFTRNPTETDERIPIISYVMVNESTEHPLMAIGAVVCIGNSTYYIQHNSKQPISDDTVSFTLRRVMAQPQP